MGPVAQPVMIAALNRRTASGRYANRCIRTPLRKVAIPKRASKAVAIHPPERGKFVGRSGRGTAPPLFVVVNVNVVVAGEFPGVTVGDENAAVVSIGRFVAVNVTALGKPLLPGVI